MVKPLKETRPWGYYIVMDEMEKFYKIKKIIVNPTGRLSLQKHKYRDERWIVLFGEAFVTVDDKKITMSKGKEIYIPKGSTHRLENKSEKSILVILEIAMGQKIYEEDIIRLDDDYGRA